MFKIISKDKKTKARLGQLNLNHGKVATPAFVPVGSGATVKTLIPEEIRQAKIDIFFVNTYHMIFRPGIEVIEKLGGLHRFMNWPYSLMTDSGGFQAFSLSQDSPRTENSFKDNNLVKINDQGIRFKSVWDGRLVTLDPRESLAAQKKLGADIIMSFDECTFYPISRKRAKEAMDRTHHWAKIGIDCKKNLQPYQALYGIVQGSVFRDLRLISAKFITSLPFDGFAIGSVANSKEPRKKVFAVLNWTMPLLLRTQKAIHFLGIGEIEDIFLSIEKGIDSLDCVTPTRMARMGWIFTKEAGLSNRFRFDLSRKIYALDKKALENNCACYTCRNFTKAYLHHLLRSRELLYYRLATIHNLYFFGNLMEKIREAIAENSFLKLKRDWLGY